jgi:hypothetical protein
MKSFVLFVALLLMVQRGLAANLVLIEFETDNYDSTRSWLSEVERLGVS